MLAELSIITGYTVIACPVPFPVVVVAYAAVGFGEALQIAYNNVSKYRISGCSHKLRFWYPRSSLPTWPTPRSFWV